MVAQFPVAAEQLRQLQLWCCSRQAINYLGCDQPLRQLNTDLAQVFLEAPHHHVFEIHLPHGNTAAEAGGVKDLEQG